MPGIAIAPIDDHLLEQLDSWQPHIVLQELLLPHGTSGIETRGASWHARRRCAVIALTASTDDARLVGALRAGAAGQVREDADPETLLAAVRAVAHGRTYVDPSIGPLMRAGATQESLTRREIDVLRHLALGRSNREIAAALEIGDETVKTHVAKVLAKLGSRTARRRWCRRSRADWFRSMNQKPTSYGRVLLRAWRMIASM